MISGSRSLMDFIQMPLIVGDPDGRAVYVNPVFETDFLIASEDVVGRPLANLFDGGGREAVLNAVAQVCEADGKDSARISLFVQERGYRVHVSAVEVEGGRVGVILLLVPEESREGRLQAFRREVMGALDELSESLTAISAQTDGPNAEHQRLAVADAVRCVDRMRKWGTEVAASLNKD